MNPEMARRQMVQQQVRAWDVFDERVLEALGSVARERFVPAGFAEVAYADTEIPLGYGQVMLRPIIEGRLLQALELAENDEVLEIGTGSGYLCACLSRLCASVTSIDLHEDFVTRARDTLDDAGVANATLECMDASDRLPEGKFDAIAVTGSAPRIDERFTAALKPGGRLFMVVGESPQMDACLVIRGDEGLQKHVLFETDIPALENFARKPLFSF